MSQKKEFEILCKNMKKIFLSKEEVVQELLGINKLPEEDYDAIQNRYINFLSLQELAQKILNRSNHEGTIFSEVRTVQINKTEETEKNNVLANLHIIRDCCYSALSSSNIEEIDSLRDLISIYKLACREIDKRQYKTDEENTEKKISNFKNFINSSIFVKNKIMEIIEGVDLDSLGGGHEDCQLIDIFSFLMITEC